MIKITTVQQKKTPLFDALKKYSKSDMTHFDVPGHKKHNNPELSSSFGEKILNMDTNSTRDLDLLGNSAGVILEAENLLASAYDADHAFFLVNGTTSGVQYMILTACSPKDKIIMPRNVHKSAINGVILSGAIPIFIQPEIDDEFGIAHSLTFESVKNTISDHPDAKALMLINPTYFGSTSDLRSIIKYCHRHSIAVLVDEAHGAHFPFHPDFPYSASTLGADMSTVSLHKTGGSLTQSSALLLNEGIFEKHQVRTVINLMQTTSPSYLLMSSLDVARQKLMTQGKAIFSNLLVLVREAKQRISKIPGMLVLSYENVNGAGLYDYDETKIVVKVSGLGLTGFEVYNILKNEYKIQIELAEMHVILAITSIGDDKNTIQKLVDALEDISSRFFGKNDGINIKMLNFNEKPKLVISPREAFYSNKKLIPLQQAEGEISGESVMIYPPGIPLIIPGERITSKIIEHYQFYLKHNCVIAHDEDEHGYIKVLGD